MTLEMGAELWVICLTLLLGCDLVHVQSMIGVADGCAARMTWQGSISMEECTSNLIEGMTVKA